MNPDQVHQALEKAIKEPIPVAEGKSKIKNNGRDNSLFGKATALTGKPPNGNTLLEYFVQCLHAWATHFEKDESMTGRDKPLLNVYLNANGIMFLEPILTRHVNSVLKRITLYF